MLTSQRIIAKELTITVIDSDENSMRHKIENQQWAQWILNQVHNLPLLQAKALN